MYDEYYRSALILLRDGIISYKELKKLTDDEFREIFYAYYLLREEEDEEYERLEKEAKRKAKHG
ncbi:hypothetical protein [uncultured Anaerococcus sp.]|uniref:hypothetical protein n=1 Tax=uncultured Anaerococcus sp. TaxID=293428 RepID=UPI002600AE03|nr:hypothetical protein [uncultured Anaerococcus sp.]